ncbi:MAG: hypothetical protein K1X49_09230 [Saprospiraceae bacterium]|jgi:hypothetical protein|nr:hypothetical protein [Saprospiraceae bacterium]
MTKISTKNISKIPDIEGLKKLCKALATLDTIICREWELRYYSYDKNWDTTKGEEYFSMRDGSGDEFQILFCKEGSVINGQAHESEMCNWTEVEIKPKTLKEKITNVFGKKESELVQTIWKGVVDDLPTEFHEFIFGEPVKSKGTTFCIWRKHNDIKWNIGNIEFPKDKYGDGSEDLIYILDNDPKTYRKWAMEYFDETFEEHKLDLELVQHIYDNKPLTKEIILKINPHLDDFQELKKELDEIGYRYEDL